jgi:FdhD protein
MQTAVIQINRFTGATFSPAADELAIEEPLEIRIAHFDGTASDEQAVSVTMRTPGADQELALGFLFTEGLIQSHTDIREVSVAHAQANTVTVRLAEGIVLRLGKTARNFYMSSSCGVCGKASLEAVRVTRKTVPAHDDIRISPELLYALPERLRAQQAMFNHTGGIHASALFNLHGGLIAVREDVGRHNALDKLIGAALQQQALPLSNSILLLSGRASFELIQKAAMAGIRIVAAVGAPSSLAVELAAEAGITLAGFLRGERMNLYTAPQRIAIGQ